MANTVKYFNLVLSFKNNGYRGYKWILAFLKLRGLIKRLIKKIKVKKIGGKGVK